MNKRINYNGKDLVNKNLSRTNLKYVSFKGCYLYNVNFEESILIGADFTGAIIINTNFKNTDLCFSKFRGAEIKGGTNFENAQLNSADLTAAELTACRLYHANMKNTILTSTKFTKCDMRDVNLKYSYKNCTKFKETKFSNNSFKYPIPTMCPEYGSFIAWTTKVDEYDDFWFVKLQIPEDAKRLTTSDNTCRCSKAKIISIENLDGNIKVNSIYVEDDEIWTVGDIIEVKDFNDNETDEGGGIEFRITRNYEFLSRNSFG